MTHESYARAPLKGTIEWSGGGLNLNGTTRVYGRTDPLYGEFQSLDIVGAGRPGTDTAGWEYRYHGYFEGRWPPFRGEVAIPLNQHLTIVGSVIRVKAHNGVSRPAGYVGSFIAVKQPGQPPGFPGLWNYRSFHNKKAAVYKTTALQRTQPQAHELLLQEAVFKLETPTSTTLQGAIEWEGGSLGLNGRVFQPVHPASPDFVADSAELAVARAEPPNFKLVGTGRPGTATDGWEYGYRGWLTRHWPSEASSSGVVEQQAAIVGDVIRYKSHGEAAPAGYCAPFIAVKQ